MSSPGGNKVDDLEAAFLEFSRSAANSPSQTGNQYPVTPRKYSIEELPAHSGSSSRYRRSRDSISPFVSSKKRRLSSVDDDSPPSWSVRQELCNTSPTDVMLQNRKRTREPLTSPSARGGSRQPSRGRSECNTSPEDLMLQNRNRIRELLASPSARGISRHPSRDRRRCSPSPLATPQRTPQPSDDGEMDGENLLPIQLRPKPNYQFERVTPTEEPIEFRRGEGLVHVRYRDPLPKQYREVPADHEESPMRRHDTIPYDVESFTSFKHDTTYGGTVEWISDICGLVHRRKEDDVTIYFWDLAAVDYAITKKNGVFSLVLQDGSWGPIITVKAIVEGDDAAHLLFRQILSDYLGHLKLKQRELSIMTDRIAKMKRFRDTGDLGPLREVFKYLPEDLKPKKPAAVSSPLKRKTPPATYHTKDLGLRDSLRESLNPREKREPVKRFVLPGTGYSPPAAIRRLKSVPSRRRYVSISPSRRATSETRAPPASKKTRPQNSPGSNHSPSPLGKHQLSASLPSLALEVPISEVHKLAEEVPNL